MSHKAYKQLPLSVDADSSPARISPIKATSLYNLTDSVNNNPNGPQKEGLNAEVLTPYEGNLQLTGPSFPSGNNKSIGAFHSKTTNCVYAFLYNDAGNHSIYRIFGLSGTLQFVYVGPLNFQDDPQYYIAKGRCVLYSYQATDPVSGIMQLVNYLIFTDNFNDQRLVSVEDSVNTNFFNTGSFPYFLDTDPNWDPVYLINLGVQPPVVPITAAIIPPGSGDVGKQNLIINSSWRFRCKYIDVFGRESEHSIISPEYIATTGTDCMSTTAGLGRGFVLTVPAGNPLVDKIQIECSQWNSNSPLSQPTAWVIFDTINKYRNTSGTRWYNRAINSDYTYNSGTNSFSYNFYADHSTTPLDPKEVNRLFNPLPRLSSSVVLAGAELALANNLRDFDLFDDSLLNKISFNVNPITGTGCLIPTRTIVMYAIIYSVQNECYGSWAQAVHADHPDIPDGMFIFGYNGGQTVVGNQTNQWGPAPGFIGYLAGTGYQCISEQVIYDFPSNSILPFSTFPAPGSNAQIVIQRFTFTDVRAGRYVFRIAHHQARTTDPHYQKTSTMLSGVTHLNDYQTWGPGFLPTWVNYEKSFEVDVTAGNYTYNINTLLTIISLDGHTSNPGQIWVGDGYLLEDETFFIPVELQPLKVEKLDGTTAPVLQACPYTDHNGYFFGYWNDTFATFPFRFHFNVDVCTGTNLDIYSPHIEDMPPTFQSSFFVYTGSSLYPANARRQIKGQILNCGSSTVGLSNILVVILEGQYGFTDVNGNYLLIVHNRYDAWVSDPDQVIFSQNDQTCPIVDCAGTCNFGYLADIGVAYVACTGGLRITDNGISRAKIAGANLYGPQTGGKYNLGIVGHDWMGRCSSVQRNKTHTAEIPSIVVSHNFNTYKIGWILDSATRFPLWVKWISFWITNNLRFGNFISWAADLVVYVDNTGSPTLPSIASQIKIYYASLAEYNNKNNLSTTSTWQIIDNQNNNQGVVTGDIVEFLINGDGVFFSELVSAVIKYDETGSFFLIDYDSRLAGLLKGCLFRFVRPRKIDDSDQDLYFELPVMIPVVAGVPAAFSGTFDYVDSYFLRREIPVPTTTETAAATAVPGSTSTIQQTQTTEVVGSPGQTIQNVLLIQGAKTTQFISTTDVLTSFSFYFESLSPSDLWGRGAKTLGRVNVQNTFEYKKRLGSEIARSAEFNGTFNGLSYYDEKDVVDFEKQDQGQILVLIGETNTFMVICENDYFLIGFKDNMVVINASGQVVGSSAGDDFGNPQTKFGRKYGCHFIDINTIREDNGIVMWVDRNVSALIWSDFNNAIQVEDEQFAGIFKQLIATQNAFALVSQPCYNVAGIDPYANHYYLTSFIPANNSWANTDSSLNYTHCMTFVIDRKTRAFKGFIGVTPEYYSEFNSFFSQKNMLSYKQGKPYKHHGNGASNWNKFFGVQVKKMFTIVVNEMPDKVKRFMYNEVYINGHKLIISAVTTESGQVSRILDALWDKRSKFYCADYKCDLNTVFDASAPAVVTANPLYEGDTLYGRWATVTYQSGDADDGLYCEITSIVNYFIFDEKSAD